MCGAFALAAVNVHVDVVIVLVVLQAFHSGFWTWSISEWPALVNVESDPSFC